jgi:Kiwa protein KwaB-like
VTDGPRPDYETDLDELRTLLTDPRGVTVVVAAGDSAAPFAELRQLSLGEGVGGEFISTATAELGRLGRTRRFIPGYKPDAHEALVVELADVEPISNIVGQILAPADLEVFRGEEEFSNHFRAFAAVVSVAGGRAAFVRRSSPRKELLRSGLLALVLGNQGTFNVFEERVFLFDQEVDLIAWRGHLYVLSVSALNALFPAFEIVMERVRTTITAVTPFISNAEAFSEATLTQPQMRFKLMSIAARPYLARLTIEILKDQITRRALPIPIATGDDGVDRLQFEAGREQRWLILKLLDDDYLDSMMTAERYEVNSKLPS